MDRSNSNRERNYKVKKIFGTVPWHKHLGYFTKLLSSHTSAMTSTDVPDTLKWNNTLYSIEKAQTKLPTFVRKVTELQVKAIKCLCSSLEMDRSTTIRAILFLHSYFSGDYRVLRANFASTHVALVVYWAQCDALQKQGKNITDSERTSSASASPFQENSYFKKVCTASFKLLEVEKFFNSKVKSSQPNNSAYNQYGQLLFNFNESFTAKRAKAERITDHESELKKYAFLFGNDEKSYNKFVKIFESVVEFSVAGQYELSDLIACLVYLVAPLLSIDLEALGQLEFQSPAEDIGPLMTFAEDLMRCLDLKLNGVLKVPIEEGEGEEVVEIDLKSTKWILDYYSPGTARENSRNDSADANSSSPDASFRMDQGHSTKDTTAEDSNSKDPQTSKHEPSQTDDINSGASTITAGYLTNNESAILNDNAPKLDDFKSSDHSKSPQDNLITSLTPFQSSLDPIPKVLKSPLEPKKTDILADPNMEGREVIHYSGMIIIKPDPTANKGRSGSKPSSPVEEKSPATFTTTTTTNTNTTTTTAQNGRKRRWSVTEKGSKTAGSGSTVDSNSESDSRNDKNKRTRNSRKNSAY
ncbi:hypothetical protein WICPIJ_000583 [Wickerhamomyces pijperi]|uniref:Uncharacterized protein n=1 Tax=Wickerhamomyces pijperi TaxID=599730 RepID=A0A9P8TRV3_WICPI|nr:hypothetical protein WICPIJ_000583 [Wickerhamomyces pijperi]